MKLEEALHRNRYLVILAVEPQPRQRCYIQFEQGLKTLAESKKDREVIHNLRGLT